MHMRRAWLLVVSACAGHSAPVTLPSARASEVAPVAPTSCAITPEPARKLAIPARLARLAPQYFHASGREGFNDLVQGTDHYAWFDPSDLDVPIDPPAGWSDIRRSTPHFFFGWTSDAASYVARRGDAKSVKLAAPIVYDEDAVEDAHGLWLLLGNDSQVRLVRVLPSLESSSWTLATKPANEVDRRIAMTSNGRVAVVWVARVSTGLDLMASWLGASGFEPAIAIDHATMSAGAADLSLRSTVELRAATDVDGAAVAWRPLAPEGRVDVGSESEPPSHAVAAQIRIVTIAPGRAPTPARVHPTIADKLDFTTGVGPWPLEGNGMTSSSVRGHAFFAWIENGNEVVLAAPRDARPRVIGSGAPRLVTRPSRDGVELLLLSVDGQSLVPITCR
jgi:hypothetical protein